MATDNLAVESHDPSGAVGMPQLDVSTWPNQIFWLAVTLVAIYFLLTRVALPRIAAVLAERNGAIANDIATAEELKLKAREAEAAYNQALAEARVQSAKIAAETRAAIQRDLDAALAHADAEISAKAAESEARIGEIRAGALDSVAEVARDTARALVEAFGASGSTGDVDAAVQARLKG